ncbi:LysR family transcriptional regulator [Amorphus coralli]|uniref:LysR family transcriptional regulator n=1 Tax=Amorphus coralli TaxID=340680 RepID=UPI000366BA68|nr:LysR family transcriptional regulator [Amorphus coralli]
MSKKMDLNALVLFYEVANCQSLSSAATKLRLPKSTVSRKIKSLETQVGATLLRRGARNTSLTEIGKVLYDHSQRIISEIEDAGFHASQMQSELSGVLRISLPVDFGISWLSRLIADFSVQHSEIKLVVDINNRWIDVTEEPYDVAVNLGQPRNIDLPMRKFSSLTRGLYASPSYIDREGPLEIFQDLRKHECVVTAHQFEEGVWRLGRPEDREPIEIEPRVQVNNIGIAREVVVDGLGIGMLPNVMCRNDVAAGRLVRLLPEWNGPPVEACATYLGRRRVQRKTKVFMDFLSHHLMTDA